MPTVIATVGAADSNSYVTVAEADAYFDDSFGKSLWSSTSVADREALVITASRMLDQFILWDGNKANDSQGMEWPRTGTRYDDDVIPSKVKYATYELAYYILENNGISFTNQPIESVKVGPVAVEFSPNLVDIGIPSFIENLVADLGSSIVVGNNTVRMARMTRV